MLKGIRGGIAVTIRVFMVDDHALVRTGLRMILSAETDIEILGEAESGEEALPQIRKLKPDVVLCGHSVRTRRWARKPPSAAERALGSTSKSSIRFSVTVAEFACSVDRTMCPVSAACVASPAVSASRISPTRITSGSWRSIARRALAKVSLRFVAA